MIVLCFSSAACLTSKLSRTTKENSFFSISLASRCDHCCRFLGKGGRRTRGLGWKLRANDNGEVKEAQEDQPAFVEICRERSFSGKRVYFVRTECDGRGEPGFDVVEYPEEVHEKTTDTGNEQNNGNTRDASILENSARTVRKWVSGLLRTFMLPDGYPESITPDYTKFVIWNVLRHVFRKAHYVLGTTILLSALGVGKSAALPLSASLNWVLKDGLGMGAKVLIASRLAPIVDRDPKRWRIIGDTLMTFGTGVEMLSPLKPSAFLFFGSLSALLRQAGDAMSGPCYRVFLNSFAIKSNIGDVSSKAESQVVVGNLLGLALGVGSCMLIGDHPIATGLLFLTLSVLHLLSTYNAVNDLQLRTLNWQRLHIILSRFERTGKIPTIAEVNILETTSYLWKPPPYLLHSRLILGASTREFISGDNDLSWYRAARASRYRLAVHNGRIGVLLSALATPLDVVSAVLQARWVLQRMENEAGDPQRLRKLLDASYRFLGGVTTELENGLRKRGWEVEKLLMEMGENRYWEEQIGDDGRVEDRSTDVGGAGHRRRAVEEGLGGG